MNITREQYEADIRKAKADALRDAERAVAPDAWEYDEQFHYFYEGKKWSAQYLRNRANELDPR